MIKVGISQRALPLTEFGERRDGLDRRWYSFLNACEIVPVPLPNEPEAALRAARVTDVRGLILSGGDDLARYGGDASDGRDATEYRLLDWAIENQVPLLGVCRGMQIILDAMGTRLHQVGGHVGTRHEIVQGEVVRTVNSYHKWAATELRGPLVSTSTCGAVIEAVRHLDAPIFGIMWHPEREDPIDRQDVDFVTSLFGAGG